MPKLLAATSTYLLIANSVINKVAGKDHGGQVAQVRTKEKNDIQLKCIRTALHIASSQLVRSKHVPSPSSIYSINNVELSIKVTATRKQCSKDRRLCIYKLLVRAGGRGQCAGYQKEHSDLGFTH